MRYVLLVCLFLSACGQAGDLYLPTEPAARPAPAPAPAQAETDKKKDTP